MFHIAPPLVLGLGVRICTPGLARSAQSWMPLGLPLRTAKATMESLTMPLVGLFLPVVGDQAGLLDAGHVGLQRQRGDVGLEALDDGARLGAGAQVGLLEGHVLAGLLLPLLAEERDQLAIGLAGRGVGAQDEGGCLLGVRSAGVALPAPALAG